MKSKIGWPIFIVILFILGLIVFVVFAFINEGKPGQPNAGLVVCAALFAIVFFLLVSWHNYLIKLDAQTIRLRGLFKKWTIKKQDISSIDFFSKNVPGMTVYAPQMVVNIELNTKENIRFFDYHYRNMPRMKQFLEAHFFDKIKWPVRPPITQGLNNWDTYIIAGNPYFSLRGIFIYSILIISIWGLIQKGFNTNSLVLLLMCLLISVAIASQLYYFKINKDELIIKHHLFRWINKPYQLKDIMIFNIEQGGRAPTWLRVITKSFNSKIYCAGSLRDKHWSQLINLLNERGIPFASAGLYF